MFNSSLRHLQKTKRSYRQERTAQHQRLNEENQKLDALLSDSRIDEDTHKRLKKLLKMGYHQKRSETRLKHGFTAPSKAPFSHEPIKQYS
jgi:hypothetical protein